MSRMEIKREYLNDIPGYVITSQNWQKFCDNPRWLVRPNHLKWLDEHTKGYHIWAYLDPERFDYHVAIEIYEQRDFMHYKMKFG